jgi:hypothetical protein
MFPPPTPRVPGEKPGRRLTAASWRVLLESYRSHFPVSLTEPPLPVPAPRPVMEPWQTFDVGPWAKGCFAAGFVTLLVFPPAFPLAFPLGSIVAVLLGINHIQHHMDEVPVPLPAGRVPSGNSGNYLVRSPFADWVREGRATHRAVEAALVGLPRGMRRTFWPLAQQSEDLVHSLQRLALRAQQIDEYLVSDSTASLRERVGQLRTLFVRAEDPVVREHLRQADLSLQSALRDQDDMRVLLERLKAQSAHVNATLHHVLAQLVKQRFASPEAAGRDYHAVAERLKTLRYQIDAVEQVMLSDRLMD